MFINKTIWFSWTNSVKILILLHVTSHLKNKQWSQRKSVNDLSPNWTQQTGQTGLVLTHRATTSTSVVVWFSDPVLGLGKQDIQSQLFSSSAMSSILSWGIQTHFQMGCKSTLGSSSSWTCLENPLKGGFEDPGQVLKPPNLTPFNMKEQQFSNLLPDVRASDPISERKATSFCLLVSTVIVGFMWQRRQKTGGRGGVTCNKGPQPDLNQGHCGCVLCTVTIRIPVRYDLTLFLTTMSWT